MSRFEQDLYQVLVLSSVGGIEFNWITSVIGRKKQQVIKIELFLLNVRPLLTLGTIRLNPTNRIFSVLIL
jgi:hypothetical protein